MGLKIQMSDTNNMFTVDFHSLEYGDVLLCETITDETDPNEYPPWVLFMFVAYIFNNDEELVYGHWLELCENNQTYSFSQSTSRNYYSLDSLFNIVPPNDFDENKRQFQLLQDDHNIDTSRMDFNNLLVAIHPMNGEWVSNLSQTFIHPFQMDKASNLIPVSKRKLKKKPKKRRKVGTSTRPAPSLAFSFNILLRRRRNLFYTISPKTFQRGDG